VTTELEERRPRWPVWYGPAAFASGLIATLIVFAIAGAIAAAAGHDLPTDGPGIQLGGTLVQDSFFVAAAVLFASFVAPPKPWQFGLRWAPLQRTLVAAAIVWLAPPDWTNPDDRPASAFEPPIATSSRLGSTS